MKKAIALLLCSTLIILCFVPLFAFPYASNASTSSSTYRIREIPELRETNSDTYLLSDGNYECVIYSEDKYYKTRNGALMQIDNSIISSTYTTKSGIYHFANRANSISMHFSKDYPNILINSDDNSLSFSLLKSNITKALIGSQYTKHSFSDFNLNTNNCISYSNVFPNTDLVYACNNNCLKEYIIISDPTAPNEFYFSFDTSNYYIKDDDGLLKIYNKSNELVFEMGNLFAIDSVANRTDKVYYTIISTTDSETIICISVDSKFLNNPSTVFPILIDPSITISGTSSTNDTYISSKSPNYNFDSYTQLRTGKNNDYGICRTYIKFNIPSSVTTHIASAKVFLKQSGGVLPNIKAYRVTSSWNSTTITWNNKPTYTAISSSNYATQENDNWFSLDIEKMVSAWRKGTFYNYGLLITDVNEGNTSQWTAFYSSNTAYPYKPELRIVYTPFDTTLIALKEHDSNGHIYPRNKFFITVSSYVSTYRDGNTYTAFEYDYTYSQIVSKMQSTLLFYIHTHGTRTEIELGNGTNLTLTNMNGVDLSNMKCILLLTCFNGQGGYSTTRVRTNTPANMVERLVICGCKTVIGFDYETKISDCNDFATSFSYLTMVHGYTICDAIANIDCSGYINSDIKDHAVIGGDNNQTLN
ncbi:MAG: DNRLRE domain-containing protein [Lachnospiraceae bacterium]|nr:DNRLRE domain-containing protein [Lachnospiraceae bacterium]